MAIYVYRCEQCGQTFERRQSIADAPLAGCPECNGRVQRVIQPVGIVFKGSGFYVTDHKKRSSTRPGESTSKAAEAKEGS